MNPVTPRVMSTLDQMVCGLIVRKYGMPELDALRAYLGSETYRMVDDPLTELYLASPYIILDLWECEKVTGEPRNSVYIREEW